MKYNTYCTMHELQNSMQRETHQIQDNYCIFHFPEMSRKGKSIATVSTLVVAWGWEEDGK